MAFLPYLIPKSWARLHQRACIKNYIWGIGLFYFSFNTFIQPEIRKFPAFAFPPKIHYDSSRLLWLEAEPWTGDRKRRVDCGQGGQCEQWFSRRKKMESFHIWSPARQVRMQDIHDNKPASKCGLMTSIILDAWDWEAVGVFTCLPMDACSVADCTKPEGDQCHGEGCAPQLTAEIMTPKVRRDAAPLLNTDSSGNVACLRQEALFRTHSHGGPACKLLLIRTQPNS